MWRTHLAFGFLSGLVVYSLFKLNVNFYLFLGVVMFSSLLADIDHEDSKIGRKVKPLSWLINNLLGHRGVMHSLLPLVLISLLLGTFGYFDIAVGFFVGYLSHLIADMLTIEGINFFYPLRSRISGFIRTGGIMESLFFIICLVLIVLNFFF